MCMQDGRSGAKSNGGTRRLQPRVVPPAAAARLARPRPTTHTHTISSPTPSPAIPYIPHDIPHTRQIVTCKVGVGWATTLLSTRLRGMESHEAGFGTFGTAATTVGETWSRMVGAWCRGYLKYLADAASLAEYVSDQNQICRNPLRAATLLHVSLSRHLGGAAAAPCGTAVPLSIPATD